MATILIVDDIAAYRSPLVTLLGRQGHRVIEASDGRKALDAVTLVAPDLIITDVLMPVMDGYELMRHLQNDPATSSIPVLFYTAPYTEREARALAQSRGLPYVLTKPADPDRVLAIVASVLSKQAITPDETAARESQRHQLRLWGAEMRAAEADLRGENAQLRAVINVTLQIAAERESAQLLANVCAATRDLFGATHATIGIVDRGDRLLQKALCCGAGSESTCSVSWVVPGQPSPGILGEVVESRHAIRGDNPGGDPAALGLPPEHPPVEAYVVAPLTSDGHVYGWLGLTGNEGRSFTDHDEQLLQTLAAQVGHVYELAHEIAVRKEAERALRHERDRAQLYLDAAGVILLALDRDGRIILANRHASTALGWSSADLLGADFISRCLPERVQDDMRLRFLQMCEEAASPHTSPVVTKDGCERQIEWQNTQLRDRSGRVIGIFSSGSDVTAHHDAITALRLADERMQFAFEAAGVGIWDFDPRTGTVVWSREIEAQHGVPHGTFGGTFEAFVSAVHPGDQERVRAIVETAFTSGQPYRLQYRIECPDDSVRWLDGAGRIVHDADGVPQRGVGISLDVTERRALEGQSQQTQKMEAVGRLAGGVAHDFNNLLTAILGYCELLLDGLPGDDVLRLDVAEIQNAGNSAADLTRQLLAFSRKEVIEETVFDLNAVLGNMRPMLERLIGEDVTVVLRTAPAPATIRADRGQIQQVVMNLALNARDAMSAGGTLTIDAWKDDAASVALRVTDTGVGMAPEVQRRLFEPFFTTKGQGQGTGLGLATVNAIVMRCGGSIAVDSVVGRGTIFTVLFPGADAGASDDAPAAVRPELPRAAHTLLLVEDSNPLRALATRLLERQGYTVWQAANAFEAVAVADEHREIDLLLTDVVMPGGSGPDLAKTLGERMPHLRVIYMSGYAEDASLREGVFAGDVAFLRKPFTSADLGQKVRDVLEGVTAGNG